MTADRRRLANAPKGSPADTQSIHDGRGHAAPSPAPKRALIAQGRIWRWAGVTVIALFALPVIIQGVGRVTGVWR